MRRTDVVAAVCALALLTTACGGPSSEDAAPTAADGQGSFGESTIAGRITFEGTPPTPARLRMDSDPLCDPKGATTSEVFLVSDSGGLQNVFVHVTEGVPGSYAPPQEPITLDQMGCRYIPHVFGVQAGQPVEIRNSDPAVHNVNAAATESANVFNLIQQPGSEPRIRMFDRPEVMVPIRCDVHPWMNSWAGVKSHPFFAVSGEDGTFAIERLPAGTYTVEAWHEELGTQRQMVTVGEAERAALDFTFAAGK